MGRSGRLRLPPRSTPDLSASRLPSLDVFRGATIALMILVNNPGDWAKTYAPLLHAEWHGWTPTDLVFPFFLFIVGVAIPLSLAGREPSRELHLRILQRSAILFGLGLLLAWAPFYTVVWERARIPGVLQRIGVVYLFAALAYLHLRWRARLALSLSLLAGYWVAMKLGGDLSPQGNLAFRIDHAILGAHTWRYAPGPGDPEGILSTAPAVVSALAGIFAGEWLRSPRSTTRKLVGFLVAGSLASGIGLLLHPYFPINKNLWSPSYVVFTTGVALLCLGLCHELFDRRGAAWAKPFEVFGKNSILAFVGSGALAKALLLIKLDDPGGTPVSLQKVLYSSFYAPHLPDYLASLAWALSHVLLWLAVVWWLDRRRIYLKT